METKGPNTTHLLEELKKKKKQNPGKIPNVGKGAEKPGLSYNVGETIKP